jgi:hypothetical protein
MSDDEPQKLSLLSKLALVFIIALVVTGVLWHGLTVATFQHIWHDLVEKPGEPMRFRFILQPLMAAIVAFRDGLKDARKGRSPYFWTVIRNPGKRVEQLEEGLNATARIILLGIGVDAVYQVIVLKRFYPNEAVVVALLLAFIPYLILRGPVARAARWWLGRASPHRIS